jgi:hypothetical protein
MLDVFVPRGVVQTRKFEFLKDTFIPKFGEREGVIATKLNNYEAFVDAYEAKIKKLGDLLEKKGEDITVEDFGKLAKNDPFRKLTEAVEAEDQEAVFKIMETIKKKDAEEEIKDLPSGLKEFDAEINTPEEAEEALKVTAENQQKPQDLRKKIEKDPNANVAPIIYSKGLQGRAVAKAFGGVANLVDAVVRPFDHLFPAKEDLKPRDWEKTFAKGYDYVTGGKFKPKTTAEKVSQKATQFATETGIIAAPIMAASGGLAAAPLIASMGEAYAAGGLYETAKTQGYGKAAQLMAIFSPQILKRSPQAFNFFKSLYYDPSIAKDMGLNMARAMDPRNIPTKVKTIYQDLKKRLNDPIGSFIAKRLNIKEEQISPFAEEAMKQEKTALSQIFNNEQVASIEARAINSQRGRDQYEPIFKEVNDKTLQEYKDILARDISKRPEQLFQETTDVASREIRMAELEQALVNRRAQAKVDIGKKYDVLNGLRTEDATLNPEGTKKLVNELNRTLKEMEVGGVSSEEKPIYDLIKTQRDRIAKVKPIPESKIAKVEKDRERFLEAASNENASKETIADINNTFDKKLADLKQYKPAKISEIEAADRKLNQEMKFAFRKQREFKPQENYLIKGKEAYQSALQGYGVKNPKYAKVYREIQKEYRNLKDTILNDSIYSFLYGETPKGVLAYLTNPEKVKTFDKIMSIDPKTRKLGQEIKLQRASNIVKKNFLDQKTLQPRVSIPAFSDSEKRMLLALVGKNKYDDFTKLQNFANMNKNAYQKVNWSRSGSEVIDFTRSQLMFRGFGRILQGKYKDGLSMMFGSSGSDAYMHLLTDKEVQKAILKAVKEGTKNSGNVNSYKSSFKNFIEKMSKAGLKKFKTDTGQVVMMKDWIEDMQDG